MFLFFSYYYDYYIIIVFILCAELYILISKLKLASASNYVIYFKLMH